MKGLSSWQLYGLMLLFQLGTNVVFGIASPAKQDAWITAGISLILGMVLLWMYSMLYGTHANTNWSGLLSFAFGRYIGAILSVGYVFIFIYSAARNLRDLGELTNNFLLQMTPMWFVMVIFQCLVTYVCYAGVQRLGKLAELNVPIIIFLFLLQIILLVASGTMRLSLLTPVAAEWKPIFTTVFPASLTVPYAEVFAFAAFWSTTMPPKGFRKIAILSAATAGLMFMVLDILAVSTLGPEVFSRSFFPLMTTFQMVNIADFIQDLDPFIVTNYMTSVLFKTSIFTYAACAMISDQWKMNHLRAAVIPVSIIVCLFAIYMADNLSSHLFTGHQWAVWVIFLPFFVVLPMLALLTIKLKSKLQYSPSKGDG
ncbi:GerAB/ArcD/ProY family transporter [Paenibacillus wynnii]|uniref:GerAB/ArcD/ProY family transporter n=1 Tax=Paenibacillus wynnii TaxID=268407 RepID=UPI00279505EC|nr:GerAB/ArcD/ProY family transporter [Paenibacillus wynnii]MDQ0196587.1 spore germination protein KB [Paenibacillus wynnii]